MRAIERINNPIKLLPFAKQANVNVVNSFFNNLKTINVDSKITKEDLRWQVMEFAVQRNTDDNEYIDTVFGLDCKVIKDPVSHSPFIVPRGRHYVNA